MEGKASVRIKPATGSGLVPDLVQILRASYPQMSSSWSVLPNELNATNHINKMLFAPSTHLSAKLAVVI